MLGQMEERILIAKVVKWYGWVASQNACKIVQPPKLETNEPSNGHK
jgi:hypothetical protein